MANVKHSSLSEGIEAITDYAPVVIFISIVAMYFLTGWLQHHFMKDVLVANLSKVEALSFQFPILIQSLRFILGFICVSFFSKKRWFFGVLVFMLSIWLAVFEFSKVEHMANFWTNIADVNSSVKIEITKDIITGVMTILIWGALILEFFLAAWIGYDENNFSVVESNPSVIEINPSIPEGIKKNNTSFSSNGAS